MGNVIFGEKTGAKHMCFMIDPEEKELHCAWFPTIEENGQMMHITDNNAPVKMVETTSRYKAKKLAKEFLERMKIKSA